MQIRQLQVAHETLQDRLLIRIATQANEEFRIWLTRRFLRDLWPHLASTLAKLPATAMAVPLPPANPAPPAQPSFDQPFTDDNATYPLGMMPLLTSELKFDTLSDGNTSLTFREGRERSFQLTLTPDLLQALCAMFRAGSEQAQWNLSLDYSSAEAKPAPIPQAGHSSGRLH